MQFQSPEFLWFLLLVPALIAAYILAQRRRSRFALRYSSLSMVKEALGKNPGWRRHLPPALFLIGMTFMLIALARPTGIVWVPKDESTIILAIDVSRSMSATDIQPSRIEAAKAAARAFIQQQDPSTRIGIVSFSGNAALVQAPTTDRTQLLAAVNRLTVQNSTAIGSGIMTSLDAIFEDPLASQLSAPQNEIVAPTPTPTPLPKGIYAPATIILLTDGRNRTGPDPIDAAHTAADRGVRVYTVGVGTTQGGSIPQQGGGRGGQGFGGRGGFGGQNGFGGQGGPGFGGQGFFGGGGFRADLDEATLKAIAQITDAKYFLASDAQMLMSIYNNIDKQVILTQEQTEATVFFSASGFIFLLMGGLVSLVWFNRLP